MPFFPDLTEQFHSPLAPAEALAALRVQVAPPVARSWAAWAAEAFTGPLQAFRGQVGADGFALQRVINYRNDLLPRITGRVVPGPAGVGSTVTLRHQLAPFVRGFAILWLGVVSCVALATAPAWWQSRVFDPAALIPLGMLAFGVAFFTGPFWLEVRQSRPLLLALLRLEALPPPGPPPAPAHP